MAKSRNKITRDGMKWHLNRTYRTEQKPNNYLYLDVRDHIEVKRDQRGGYQKKKETLQRTTNYLGRASERINDVVESCQDAYWYESLSTTST